MGSLWMALRTALGLAGPTVTLLYPLYESINALESPRKEDDQQWLTYWMLYSFLVLFELVAGNLLAWIPIWPYLKLAIICWLVLPQFEGAAFVYEHIISKHVRKLQEGADKKFSSERPPASDSKISEAHASTEHFVEKTGEDASRKASETATTDEAKNQPIPATEPNEREER